MLKDMISHVKNEMGFAVSITGTSVEVADVDVQGYAALTLVCPVSPGDNSSDSITYKLEHKEEGGTYEAVTAEDLLMQYGANDGSVASGVFATVAGNGVPQMVSVGYIGDGRYLRLTAEESNGATSHVVAAAIVKEGLQKPQDD